MTIPSLTHGDATRGDHHTPTDATPEERVEDMLADQMTAAHGAALACLERARQLDRDDAGRDRDLRLGARLLAVFSWQVRTLDIWRHKRLQNAVAEKMLISWLDSDSPAVVDPLSDYPTDPATGDAPD